MKKAILRWVIVLSALYCMGHILFDFKETHLMRILLVQLKYLSLGAFFSI